MNRRSALASLLCAVAYPAAAQSVNAPNESLSSIQGAWRGKLTYRDYSRPDKLVALPTRLFVALLAPNELAFHYIFDDGPSKTVHSYERMAFDFDNKMLVWTSGYPTTKTSRNRITSSQAQDGGLVVAFERDEENGTVSRYVMTLSQKLFVLGKEEGTSSAGFQFRNKYEFLRGEA